MGIFKKLFGSKKESEFNDQMLNNGKLINLLESYGKNESQENYGKVLNEIVDGDSILILPSINFGSNLNEWGIIKKGSSLKLTSVFNQDGLNVLGVFTTPEKLVEWSKKETEYTAMKSKDVLNFCQTHEIERIVIDTGSPTMFVIEKNRDDITTEVIEEDTEVKIGPSSHPISGELLKKFQLNFAEVNVIKEVYQYAMLRNNEVSLSLGCVLDMYSDDSSTACIRTIHKSMEGETLEFPLEVFMIEEEKWLQAVKEIENSLMYSRV